MCSWLLFLHAITGCDFTHFGCWEKDCSPETCKKRLCPSVLCQCVHRTKPGNGCNELGCQAMAVLFGGTGTDSLATIQYNTFSKKVVSSSSFLTPERLPPTEYVTKFHCRRTYFQIMIWIGQQDGMDAVKWGWNVENDQLILIMSQMTAVPDSLLKVIHCNCSNACKTFRCSCRKYGLPCNAACRPCQLGYLASV